MQLLSLVFIDINDNEQSILCQLLSFLKNVSLIILDDAARYLKQSCESVIECSAKRVTIQQMHMTEKVIWGSALTLQVKVLKKNVFKIRQFAKEKFNYDAEDPYD